MKYIKITLSDFTLICKTLKVTVIVNMHIFLQSTIIHIRV